MNSIRLYLCLVVLVASLTSCSNSKKEITEKQLFENVLLKYGTTQFKNSKINFTVSDLEYEMIHDSILTFNTVIRNVDTTNYRATYKNGLIEYYVNNKKLENDQYLRKVLDLKLDAFLFLTSIPHTLTTNDVSFQKMEDIKIRKKTYYTLYAKILQEAPSTYDEFYLYIDKEQFTIAYQAEKHALSGGHPIFKKYYNHRNIKGIGFSDYYTFALSKDTTNLDKMYTLYQAANLREIEDIKLKNIKVEVN